MLDELTKKGNINHDLMMIKMIALKVRNRHGIKSNSELAKLINYSEDHIGRILSGKAKVSPKFLKLLMFAAGITEDDLNKQYINRDLDEYINPIGHLILDGVDYGKLI